MRKICIKQEKDDYNGFHWDARFIVFKNSFSKWVWFKMYIYNFVENFMDYQNI